MSALRPEDADDAGEAEQQERVGLQAEEGVDGGEPAQLVAFLTGFVRYLLRYAFV